jgi:vacuolar-type H+-ATPase subunit H
VKEDIIEILKDREKQMEALIQGAKDKGGKIREEAVQRAREIRSTKARAAEQEIASMREPETERIKKEVQGINKEAEKAVAEIRKKAVERKSEAVDFVASLVLGGLLKYKEKKKT